MSDLDTRKNPPGTLAPVTAPPPDTLQDDVGEELKDGLGDSLGGSGIGTLVRPPSDPKGPGGPKGGSIGFSLDAALTKGGPSANDEKEEDDTAPVEEEVETGSEVDENTPDGPGDTPPSDGPPADGPPADAPSDGPPAGGPDNPGGEGPDADNSGPGDQSVDPSADGSGGDGALSAGGEGGGEANVDAGGGGDMAVEESGGGDGGGDVNGGGGDAVATVGERVPELGGTEGIMLSPGMVNPSISDAILESTGLPLDSHTTAIQRRIDSLSGNATSMQQTAVAAMTAKGDVVSAWVEGAAGEGRGVITTVRGEVSSAYETARGVVAQAVSDAEGTVASGVTEGQRIISEASLAQQALIDTEHGQKAADYIAMRADVLSPLTTLIEGAAGTAISTASTVAGTYDNQKGAVRSHFDSGGGGLQGFLGKAKANWAVGKKMNDAKADMTAGGQTRAAEIRGMLPGLEAQVDTFLQPISEHVTSIGEQGTAAVVAATGAAEDKLVADETHATETIASTNTGAIEQLNEDEQTAIGELDAIEQTLDADMAARGELARQGFTDAAAGFSDEYRAFMEAVRATIPEGPLTQEAIAGVLDGFDQALIELHQRHMGSLDTVTQGIQTTFDEGVKQHLDMIRAIGTSNLEESGRLAEEKATAIRDIGTGFFDALGMLGISIETTMAEYTAPVAETLAQHEADARAEVERLRQTTSATLETQAATYDRDLRATVTNYAQTVAPQAIEAGIEAEKKVEDRAKRAYTAMRGMGTDEDGLFNALRGMTPGEPGALREVFSSISNGGSIWTWLDDDLNEEEYAIATAYMNRQQGAAARLELAYNVNWYGDDEAQIEAILRGLPEEERATIASAPEWEGTRDMLRGALDGTDLVVTNALIANNVARADAARLKDKVDEARRKGDDDALHDALAGMSGSPEEVTRIAEEFMTLDGVGDAIGATSSVSGQDARAAMAEYVTREIEIPGARNRDGTSRTRTIDGAAADLATALVVEEDGNTSTAARVARFEVEMGRRGGPKQDRLEQAVYADPGLRTRLHDPDPQIAAAAQAELAQQQESFDELYRARNNGDDPSVAIDGLTREDQDERELYQAMLDTGYNSPEVAAQQMQIAMEGAGTDEDSIKRALQGMNPAEIQALRAEYQSNTGRDLYDDLGVRDPRTVGTENATSASYGELSGADRQEVELLLMGDPAHLNDDERFQLARVQRDWQVGDEGGIASGLMGGTVEADALEQNWSQLEAMRGTHIGADGTFQGTTEEYEQYRRLCRYVGITAELYQAQVDRVANGVTTAIAIAGAVVAAVLTGGAGTPLIAMAIAGGTGLASMGVNRAMKGGRYGYEDAIRDAGVTAVSVATAGVGARLNAVRGMQVLDDGTEVALSGIFNTANAWGQAAGKTVVAAGTGAVSSGATTAMDDATWKNGFGRGMEQVGYSSGRGALSSAVSTGFGESFGASRLGQHLANSGSYAMRGTGKAFEGAISNATGTSSELALDASTGRFNGEFDDAMTQVGQSAAKGLGQGFLEGAGEQFHDNSPRLQALQRRLRPAVQEVEAQEEVVRERVGDADEEVAAHEDVAVAAAQELSDADAQHGAELARLNEDATRQANADDAASDADGTSDDVDTAPTVDPAKVQSELDAAETDVEAARDHIADEVGDHQDVMETEVETAISEADALRAASEDLHADIQEAQDIIDQQQDQPTPDVDAPDLDDPPPPPVVTPPVRQDDTPDPDVQTEAVVQRTDDPDVKTETETEAPTTQVEPPVQQAPPRAQAPDDDQALDIAIDLEARGVPGEMIDRILREPNPQRRATLITAAEHVAQGRTEVGISQATDDKLQELGIPTRPNDIDDAVMQEHAALVDAQTNGQQADPEAAARFAEIRDANQVEPGTMSKEQSRAMLAEMSESMGAYGDEGTRLREMYLAMEAGPMARWSDQLDAAGVSGEEHARLMHMYRNRLKAITRELMTDQQAAGVLRDRDQGLYGTPDGWTFDGLMTRNQSRGMTESESHDAIIGSSRTSNQDVNNRLGAGKSE